MGDDLQSDGSQCDTHKSDWSIAKFWFNLGPWSFTFYFSEFLTMSYNLQASGYQVSQTHLNFTHMLTCWNGNHKLDLWSMSVLGARSTAFAMLPIVPECSNLQEDHVERWLGEVSVVLISKEDCVVLKFDAARTCDTISEVESHQPVECFWKTYDSKNDHDEKDNSQAVMMRRSSWYVTNVSTAMRVSQNAEAQRVLQSQGWTVVILCQDQRLGWDASMMYGVWQQRIRNHDSLGGRRQMSSTGMDYANLETAVCLVGTERMVIYCRYPPPSGKKQLANNPEISVSNNGFSSR